MNVEQLTKLQQELNAANERIKKLKAVLTSMTTDYYQMHDMITGGEAIPEDDVYHEAKKLLNKDPS